MLPQEAFPLRHEIVDTPPGPEHLQDKADSPHVSGSEAEAASLAPVDSSFSLISVSHALHDSRLPPDFFSALVCDMLRFYAEQGDVQMAVSVLIVLGERVRRDIDEQTQVSAGRWDSAPSHFHPGRLRMHLLTLAPPQEHWYTSYIDLLQRFCLWNVSNEVVKLSTSRAVSCLNQASTTLHVNCSHCKRPMSSRGWVCDRWVCRAGLGSRRGTPNSSRAEPPPACLQVPPLRQHVRRLPPCGQGAVCVVPGLQPRRPPAAHHEVAGRQLPLPGWLRPPVRVLLTGRAPGLINVRARALSFGVPAPVSIRQSGVRCPVSRRRLSGRGVVSPGRGTREQPANSCFPFFRPAPRKCVSWRRAPGGRFRSGPEAVATTGRGTNGSVRGCVGGAGCGALHPGGGGGVGGRRRVVSSGPGGAGRDRGQLRL